MKKKYLCVSLIFFVSVLLFSQELILKVKNPASVVGWVYQKGKLENSYCLYDDNYLIFASATNQEKPIIHIYREQTSSIISSSFYISNKQFVALDGENTVLGARFDDLEKLHIRKVHESLVAKTIALSPNDEMEVLGFANGFVQTHYLLKHSKKNFDIHFKAHDGDIYSVSFSSLGQYFITSGMDEKIKIWDAKTLSLIKEFSCYPESPAIFSPFDDTFVYCTSGQTLNVCDIDGKLQKEIAIIDGIRLVKFTEKKDVIAVLTDSKGLEFYNVATGKYEGGIASLANICSFDVNLVTGNILVGTEEGEVYLASKKDVKIVKEKQIQLKKEVFNSVKNDKEVKKTALSTNLLKYLALEEDDDVQESASNSPYFSIKDESPLEDPVVFIKKTGHIKNMPTKTNTKTLNETGLEEEDMEFYESATESVELDEEDTEKSTENSEKEEEQTNQDVKPKTETQEDETN